MKTIYKILLCAFLFSSTAFSAQAAIERKINSLNKDLQVKSWLALSFVQKSFLTASYIDITKNTGFEVDIPVIVRTVDVLIEDCQNKCMEAPVSMFIEEFSHYGDILK